MIVKPGTRLFFVNSGEDGGICIGEVGQFDRWVEVPLSDLPQLIKRMREVARLTKEAVVEMVEQE